MFILAIASCFSLSLHSRPKEVEEKGPTGMDQFLFTPLSSFFYWPSTHLFEQVLAGPN